MCGTMAEVSYWFLDLVIIVHLVLFDIYLSPDWGFVQKTAAALILGWGGILYTFYLYFIGQASFESIFDFITSFTFDALGYLAHFFNEESLIVQAEFFLLMGASAAGLITEALSDTLTNGEVT